MSFQKYLREYTANEEGDLGYEIAKEAIVNFFELELDAPTANMGFEEVIQTIKQENQLDAERLHMILQNIVQIGKNLSTLANRAQSNLDTKEL